MKKLFALLLAVMVTAAALAGCRTSGETLVIYTWENYVPPEVVADFERDTGIKVVYAGFSTNEEMYASFAQKADQYDIILCSDYIIDKMASEGNLLHQIDSTRIKNYGNINPDFMGLYFDPDNKYAIHYANAGAILVYDSARVDIPITGYKDLWHESLKESIVLLDGGRDIIGMTLMKMGESINETDPEILERAKNDLLLLKPNVIAFNADTPHESIIRGDASVGYMFASQAIAAQEALPSVTFVIPEEGVSYNVDCFVVSAQAPNLDNAYIFLNYILDGEVSAKASSIINYAGCNSAARNYLPEAFKNNIAINLPPEVVSKAQIYMPLGDDEILYDIIWTEFKAAN